ncbi:hypothetical protein D7Z94_18350 [Ulvibacterium marinum]|uniref:Uncharacterized protein n=2 Tax=Ulvibacterium marinum TaxID=2419782 RepID=A0A3B0CBM3_9FLAO|nr:hypothetical protein D7Z94_18350 [Ulvibacterium marinum]
MEKANQVLFNEDLHFEHLQWRSELAFWEDELKSFKNRLEELVNRLTDKKVLVRLEHYQNEFTLHNGIIDNLLEDIEIHETRIAAQTKTGRDMLDTMLTKKHLEFRHRMETQRQIYADLKKEFFRFLTKYYVI